MPAEGRVGAVWAAIETARAFYRAGNLTGTLTELRRVLREEPENADALGLLALTERRLGHMKVSLEAAQAAVRSAPESGWARAVLALTHEAMGRVRLAATAYDEALALDPDQGWAVVRRGLLLTRKGTLVRAVAYLREARTRLPSDLDIAIALADLLTRRGRLDEAEALVAEVRAMEPDHAGMLVSAGHLALRRGRREEAGELAVWALQGSADSHEAVHLLCLVRASRNPLMRLWLRWARLTARFGARGGWLAVLLWFPCFHLLGLLAVPFLLIPDVGPEVAAGVLVALSVLWLGFVVLTWVAPTVVQGMVSRERRKVRLRSGF